MRFATSVRFCRRRLAAGRSSRPAFCAALLLTLLAAWSASSAAAPGDELWWGGFSRPGVSGTVRTLLVQGADLFIGGDFTVAGAVPAPHVARYDGAGFYPVGEGLDGPVRALATWNGQLVAGGAFTHSGATVTNNIALWDGVAWQPLGQGLEGDYAFVSALAVYGGKLYAGGRFTTAGGQPAADVACWDGTAWSPLSSGVDNQVVAMAAFHGELIVSGWFSHAGGVPVHSIAAWDGGAWRAFGTGTSAAALLVFNDALYAGWGDSYYGSFKRWNGADWDALPQGGSVSALAAYQGSIVTGGALFGFYPVDTCCLVAYLGLSDGLTTHTRLEPGPITYPDGMNGYTYALAEYNGQLIVGGTFTTVTGNVAVGRLARWTGSGYEPLVPATDFSQGTDYAVTAFTSYPTGGLAVGGEFFRPGHIASRFVALWSGYGWQSLDLGDLNYARYDGGPTIEDMTTWSGKLVVAGAFYKSGFPTEGLIFNGGVWSSPPPGGPTGGVVRAVTVYNNDLYIGGDFYLSGSGSVLQHLARLTAAGVWTPLGTANGSVAALTVYRNELLIGGAFTQIGGSGANRLARWNGTTWNALGEGVDGEVRALYVAGPRLYVGGRFTLAGGQPASNVALWQGAAQTWNVLGGGVTSLPLSSYSYVDAINQHYGDIVVGGLFTTAGGAPARNLARWDGVNWAPFGSGVEGPVYALADFYGLLVGGSFASAGQANSSNLALWDDAAVTGVGPEPSVPAAADLAVRALGPNPTEGPLDLTLAAARATAARVQLLDIQGRLVRRLFEGTTPAGERTLHWDGRTDAGLPAPSGLYLLRVTGAGGSLVRKILLQR